MRFEIIDNFLSEKEWQAQYDLFFSPNHMIKWNYHEVKHEPNSFFFQYMFQKHRVYGDDETIFISPTNSSKDEIHH